jgi:hypothetical protein
MLDYLEGDLKLIFFLNWPCGLWVYFDLSFDLSFDFADNP